MTTAGTDPSGPRAGGTLLVARDGGVVTVTLNRLDAGNALTPDQRDTLVDLLGEVDGDPGTRAVVLTATGRHFCAGADLRPGAGGSGAAAAGPPTPATGTVMRLLATGSQRLIAAVLDSATPVVAAVNGTAAGIGAHLALACDLVVAAEGASFIEVFVRRGILPDGGGAYLLPRLVGLQRAKELVLLGDPLTATDAQALGLVNRVVPADKLAIEAGHLATRLAAGPTIALGLAKRLLNRSLDGDRAASFFEESMAQELVTGTDDAQEGIASFAERRPTAFRGH